MSPSSATICVACVTGVTLAKDCASFVVAAWQPQFWPKQNSPPMPSRRCAGLCGAVKESDRLAVDTTSCVAETGPPLRPSRTQLDMGSPPASVKEMGTVKVPCVGALTMNCPSDCAPGGPYSGVDEGQGPDVHMPVGRY